MRILNKTILSGMLLLQMFAICTQASSLKVNHLKCEELVNPLAIDNTTPHFSWQLNSGWQGEQQTAYQVLVASDRERLNENKADLWNSGKVTSSASTWIPYQGKLLAAKSFAYWKVRIWNKDGEVSEWSTPASFGIGLLSPQDWKAQYIGINNEDPQSPLLRKTFEWNKKGDKMLLHVNSLGYHEVYLNGSPVSDVVLTPAVSQFNRRSLSVTYDITNSLRIGKNELVIWLGKGWYQDQLPGVVKGGPFVRAQLEVRNNNVWETFQATDASWLARESGYTSFGTWRPHQFGGEEIHAKKLIALDAVSLNKVNWAPVKVADIPEHTTSPQMVEPNRIQLEFHPLSIEASGDTAWIFDMGTNLTGWTKIKFPPLEKGQRVRISYCDFLDKQQFRDNLYEDYYIAAGKEQEFFINKFNYKASIPVLRPQACNGRNRIAHLFHPYVDTVDDSLRLFVITGFRLDHDTDGDFALAPMRNRNVSVTVVHLQDVVFTDIEAFVDFLFLDAFLFGSPTGYAAKQNQEHQQTGS